MLFAVIGFYRLMMYHKKWILASSLGDNGRLRNVFNDTNNFMPADTEWIPTSIRFHGKSIFSLHT